MYRMPENCGVYCHCLGTWLNRPALFILFKQVCQFVKLTCMTSISIGACCLILFFLIPCPLRLSLFFFSCAISLHFVPDFFIVKCILICNFLFSMGRCCLHQLQPTGTICQLKKLQSWLEGYLSCNIP